MAPSKYIADDHLVLYIVAGDLSATSEQLLAKDLPNLPVYNERATLVHLGNHLACTIEDYGIVDDHFRTSQVPVYFVLGDQEFNGT